MLAGPPPRLFSLLSILFLLSLGWWYFRMLHAPSGLQIDRSAASSALKSDPIDFGIPLRFKDGVTKPPGHTYSYVIVVPKTSEEDLGWMQQELPDSPLVVYEVDNPNAKNKVPKNKGREAMVYLTYIIDHYNELPDTVLFMHPHKHAWHNNMLMGLDAGQMIKRLNHDRVARMGYMNVRCHHKPGCPDWIHMDRPGGDFDFLLKPEEIYMRRHIWEEIHPGAPIPPALSGICCAQFAVSRDRIRQVPMERFIHYRNWLLNTELGDAFSGRMFEYIWHYIFTGHETYCPAMNTCYCDGYGFCFGGRAKFDDYFKMQDERNALNEELREFIEKDEKAKKAGQTVEWNSTQTDRRKLIKEEISKMDVEMNELRNAAMERGKDPQMRLKETESWDSEGIMDYLPGNSKGPP